jgi:hypothetical protein
VHGSGGRLKTRLYHRAAPFWPSGGLQSYAVRHMTTSPDKGPVVLVYGCSECNWIYRPALEEASQISWYAQIAFEKHDCSEYAAGS